jgi:YesN/AraC family two-component response regulator
MLGNGEMTVQEVSNNLHFPNASFFGKYFKKATGMSPKQFKNEK